MIRLLAARSVALLPLVALALVAQDAPPPAKVLGPQSVVEKYDAPVAQPEKLEGLIDFPKLISAPGANDAAEVAPALTRIEIEIVGTEGGDTSDAFVHFAGASRTGAKQAALYAALRRKLAQYRDLRTTLGDVRFIQQDIAEVYRAQGFPLMAVVAPPQQIVDGRLRFQVNEFRLGAYTVQYRNLDRNAYSADAKHWSSDARLKTLLVPLLAEPIASRESLDAKVQAINRNPFRTARVVFQPGDTQGVSNAIFQIDEKRTWSVQTGYNNHATKSSGTNRYSVGGSFGNIPRESHQLSWNATLGDRIGEFQNYSLIYTVPMSSGQTLAANVNYSDTASSSIPGIDSASTTLQASLSYDRPILTRGSLNWSLNATATLKQFERASVFGGFFVGGAEFDSTQLSLAHQFNWKENTATDQVVATVVFSFAGLTARNTDENFQQFYNRADGGAATTHFVLNYARVQQLKPLSAALDGWNAETQLSWQFTGDSLAGSDNFSIGGPSVLRAYQASEVSGDDGIYGIQFLHAKPLPGAKFGALGRVIQQVNFSGFFEAGEGRYTTGEHASLWDYGLQAAVSLRGGINCTASLAFAGKAIGRTATGDSHCFVSAQWRY